MNNKLFYGVGFNTKGKFWTKVGRKPTPVYTCWKSMLGRCYNINIQNIRPTYIGCTVDPIWYDFQNFAQWYEDNYSKDGNKYQLDKDLKVLGNKVYGPDTCLFVSQTVNLFTNDHGTKRGEYLIGVCFDKYNDKFRAMCCDTITKKQKYLGRFDTELEAHLAWRKFKSGLCIKLAEQQTNEEVRQALLRWKEALDNNLIHILRV